MTSPLHVLAVDVADADAVQLASSLSTSGFVPEVARASTPALAKARLDAGVDVVVLGPGVVGEARGELIETARASGLHPHVVGLAPLARDHAPSTTTWSAGADRRTAG